MELLKPVLAIITCSLICGCETTQTGSENPAQQPDNSTFVHPFTKFVFPESVGPFHRVDIHKFDQQGKDVGIGYNSPTPIAATVYVYPGPKDFVLLPSPKLTSVSEALLDQQFQACKQDILRKHQDAKLISEVACKLVQDSNEFDGKKAVFLMSYKFGFAAQPSVSEIYVFLIEPGTKFMLTDRQFVKYRVTYPNSKHARAETVVAAFMTELIWPTK